MTTIITNIVDNECKNSDSISLTIDNTVVDTTFTVENKEVELLFSMYTIYKVLTGAHK
jgi:hypothetical protein